MDTNTLRTYYLTLKDGHMRSNRTKQRASIASERTERQSCIICLINTDICYIHMQLRGLRAGQGRWLRWLMAFRGLGDVCTAPCVLLSTGSTPKVHPVSSGGDGAAHSSSVSGPHRHNTWTFQIGFIIPGSEVGKCDYLYFTAQSSVPEELRFQPMIRIRNLS